MRKLMKSLMVGGCLLTMIAGCSQQADDNKTRLDKILESGKITMATSPDYPPLEFIDTTKTGADQYVGSDIALGKYIAKQLGVELELKIMDFSAVLAAVGEGKVDMAISGLGYKEDRVEAMEFSISYNRSSDDEVSENQVCTGHGLLVLKENVGLYQTLDDFKGKRIAAQSGSFQEGYANEQIEDVKVDIISALGDGVLRVQSKKSDALAIPCSTGQQYVDANPDLAMTTVTFNVDEEDEYDGNLIGVPKGEVELIEAINEIIKEVNEQGLYKQWEQEYSEYAKTLGLDVE